MSKKKKKKKVIHRLRIPYRLVILNEGSFEERFRLRLTPLNVVASLVFVTALFIGIFWMLVSFTPLKELIPGYADTEWRQNANYARAQVDSLREINQQQERYLEHVRLILSGQTIDQIDSLKNDSAGQRTRQETEDLNFNVSPADSALRAQISEEDQFSLTMENPFSNASSLSKSLLFKPLEGTVSSGFDAKIGHYGIDIVAPKNEAIKAVMDGSVILSTWTSDAGYVIQIQHDFNLVSVYKHNSALFKKQGDMVKAGETVAIIGDTGEHTDGPHLHFELWKGGVAVDPELYFPFNKN
ncbi:M23 family metallopeptidase [Halocola ammonii]